MRTTADVPGLTVGWHETDRYCADSEVPEEACEVIAYRTRSYGVEIGRSYLSMGFRRSTGVLAPARGLSVLQVIRVNERVPERTEIWRRTTP